MPTFASIAAEVAFATHAFASLSMGILTGIGLGAPIWDSTLRPAGC